METQGNGGALVTVAVEGGVFVTEAGGSTRQRRCVSHGGRGRRCLSHGGRESTRQKIISKSRRQGQARGKGGVLVTQAGGGEGGDLRHGGGGRRWEAAYWSRRRWEAVISHGGRGRRRLTNPGPGALRRRRRLRPRRPPAPAQDPRRELRAARRSDGKAARASQGSANG